MAPDLQDVDRDEGPLEERLPGYRYGIVLLLLFGTFVLESAGFEGAWARTATVAFQGATLVAAFLASGVNRHLMRIASAVAVAALVASIIAASTDSQVSGALFGALSFLLVFAAPVVIARAIVRRGVVDIHTVLGALCIYVMVGMLFAFTYATVGHLISDPFFAQKVDASSADYLYFSFVTLTTTGYGDLTAAGGLGRAVAVLEALAGQLYLVTIVSLLVARMATNAMPRRRGRQDAPAPSERE